MGNILEKICGTVGNYWHLLAKWILTEEKDELPPATSFDYTSGALLHCWPNVLERMEPSDQFSLLNAYSELSQFVTFKKVEMLFPLVLPILIEKRKINTTSTFSCRQVSSATKNAVSNSLENSSPAWLLRWYVFNEADKIEEFIDYAASFDGNPFLARFCKVIVYDLNCIRVAARLFRMKGEYLRCIKIEFMKSTTPKSVLGQLSGMLRNLPNLEALDVCGGFMLSPKVIRRNLHFPKTTLPQHQNLTKLNLSFEVDEDYKQYQTEFYATILSAYGDQLSELSCDAVALVSLTSVDSWHDVLSNLQSLKVTRLDMYSTPAFKILAQIYCPFLRKLELRRDNHWDSENIIFSIDTFRAIHNFWESLRELVLDSLSEFNLQYPQIDPELRFAGFPYLTKLTACTFNVRQYRVMWQLFHESFWYLQELHFETGRGHGVDPVPGRHVLNTFAEWFPNLEKIKWGNYPVAMF